MKVKDIMSESPVTVERNDALSIADALVRDRDIRHFPVLEDGKLVGMVSQRDVLHAGLSSVMGYGSKASEAYLETVPIKEVMTEDVVTVSPDDEIAHTAKLMLSRRIGCVPVVQTGELVGIVSEVDLLRCIAEGEPS